MYLDKSSHRVTPVESTLWPAKNINTFDISIVEVESGFVWKVPFGTHSWKAYWMTTLCFMAVHQPVDYCGAFIYGSRCV